MRKVDNGEKKEEKKGKKENSDVYIEKKQRSVEHELFLLSISGARSHFRYSNGGTTPFETR